MCEWHITLARIFEPLVGATWKDALEQDVLFTDGTGVLVQAAAVCKRAALLCGGGAKRPRAVPVRTETQQAGGGRVSQGHDGYLVADAHTVCDHLYKGDTPDGAKAVECACWAHRPRCFFKALLAQPDMAKTGLGLIKPLFKLERTWEDLPPEKRLRQGREQLGGGGGALLCLGG